MIHQTFRPKSWMTSGFSFFYLTRIKFITSTNTFTKSKKCHSAAHDGMAFFDAVWLAASFSSLEKVIACHQGLTIQPKHARRLLQPALSKGHQGNAFKRALRDAQRNIDKIIRAGAQGGLQWHNLRYFKGQWGDGRYSHWRGHPRERDTSPNESPVPRRREPTWMGSCINMPMIPTA